MSYCNEFFKGIKREVASTLGYCYYVKNGELVYLEGFRRFLSFSSDLVEVELKGGKISVEGENLEVERLQEDSVVLSGKISGVRYA